MDDTQLRKYLLGTLSEAERRQVEESLRLGHMTTAQLSIIEDELVDDYISDQMTTEDREHFEQFFPQDPARAEKLRFGKLLHSFLIRTSQSDQSRNNPADGGPDSSSSPPFTQRQTSVLQLKSRLFTKIAIISGLAAILAYGSFVLIRIHNLGNQIESTERKEEQLRIRIGKIEKALNDDSSSGSSLQNSWDGRDNSKLRQDTDDRQITANW